MKFFSFKISFEFIKKTDVLLLDENYANLKFKNLNHKVINFKNLNFYCLFYSIKNYLFNNFQRLKIKQIYKQTYLRMHKPNIAITHNLSFNAQDCKILCPEIKVIIYQFSFFKKKINKAKLYCDYLFLIHKKDENYLIKNKIVEPKKIYICGSIKNNERKSYFINKKKYDILYISQGTLFIPDKRYSSNEKYIIKLIDEYSRVNNCKFNIALKYYRKDKEKHHEDKIKKEIEYYNSLIKSEIGYPFKDSLELANSSKLVITLSSSFAIELISRKHKVLFLPFDDKPRDKINYYLPDKNLINIHREKNKKKIFNKISYLIDLDNNSWKSYLNKSKYFDFKFDKNNKFLKTFIKKIK